MNTESPSEAQAVTPEQRAEFARLMVENKRFHTPHEAVAFLDSALGGPGGAKVAPEVVSILNEFKAWSEKDRAINARFASIIGRQIAFRSLRAELETEVKRQQMSLIKLEGVRAQKDKAKTFALEQLVGHSPAWNIEAAARHYNAFTQLADLETLIVKEVLPGHAERIEDLKKRLATAEAELQTHRP